LPRAPGVNQIDVRLFNVRQALQLDVIHPVGHGADPAHVDDAIAPTAAPSNATARKAATSRVPNRIFLIILHFPQYNEF
jgi:hypothetical protein